MNTIKRSQVPIFLSIGFTPNQQEEQKKKVKEKEREREEGVWERKGSQVGIELFFILPSHKVRNHNPIVMEMLLLLTLWLEWGCGDQIDELGMEKIKKGKTIQET